jgi:putative DNA primase/helicase
MSGAPWESLLDRNMKQVPRSTLANAVTVLQHDPLWGPATLWYDPFLDRVLTANSAVREWRDDDDTRLTVYCQQNIGMLTVPESQIASAVRYVARQRSRHCVLEWLAAQHWDQIGRLEHAFEDFWGVPLTLAQPSDYVRAISANFFLGMVARVVRPGCQLDTMVIFEGPQGIGKSRALRMIGGPWYMLAAESVTSKDFYQILPGKLLVEIGELESFSRAEQEKTKIAISTPTDRYRSSYGRRAEDHPRQCVFAGTTNREDYGHDDTGLRRFLPIRCGEIDAAGLTAARTQLFAEAYVRILAGEPWWKTPAAPTLSAQADRQSYDEWTPKVLVFAQEQVEMRGADYVQIGDVLTDGLKLPLHLINKPNQMRVGTILRKAKWERRKVYVASAKESLWVWFAPESEGGKD